MPRTIRIALALLLASLASPIAHTAPVELHLAPTGADTASGAADAPLRSLVGARDRLRALRADSGLPEGVVVTLHDGEYPITEAVVFGPEDSGTESAPIVFRAADGATPTVHGGVTLTGWRDEDGVWVTDVPEGVEFSALFVNGERRQPARTPNAAHPFGDDPPDSDFFFTAGPVETKDAEGNAQKSATAFRYTPEDLSQFASLDGAVFVVFHSWATSLLRVKALDTENHIAEFTGPARWHFGYWQEHQRYFIEHIREGLDAPGEWFFDRATREVRYIPMGGERIADCTIVAPVARQLIVVQGDPAAGKFVDYLRFEGIDFRYTDTPIEAEGHSDAQAAFAIDAAVQFTGARHCVVERCGVRNVGNYAVWFRSGSQHNALRRCDLYDMGAGGVRIGEGASPATDAFAADHNTVENTRMAEGGRIFRSAVGVWIGRASHNEIAHNDIGHFRYTGVSVGWSWGYAESSAHHNVIAWNRIHHIGLGQLNDMGGIYCLGISPGTVLEGNRIYDVVSHPALYGGWGLYTDEGSSDILLTKNVVYRTRTGSFHQHYGKDNHVVNNILAYSQTPQVVRSREEEHNSFTFEKNIVLFDNGNLLGSTWKNGNWTMDQNLYWDESGADATFSGRSLDEWRAEGFDTHSLVADPLFVDTKGDNFELKKDSPAFALGFEAFDQSRAGVEAEK